MAGVFGGALRDLGLACVIWVRRCDASILAARSLVVFSTGGGDRAEEPGARVVLFAARACLRVARRESNACTGGLWAQISGSK